MLLINNNVPIAMWHGGGMHSTECCPVHSAVERVDAVINNIRQAPVQPLLCCSSNGPDASPDGATFDFAIDVRNAN